MVAFNLTDSPVPSIAKMSGGRKAEDFVKANDVPEWLPEGWIMELRYATSGTKTGTTVKRYVDQSTGRKFYSKPEVFQYLKSARPDTCTDDDNDDKMIVVNSKEDNEVEETQPPDECGLPKDWTVTLKTLQSGRKYKCFVAPTGEKFYSKSKVLRHLAKVKNDSSSSKQKDCKTGEKSNEKIDHIPEGGGTSNHNVSGDVKDSKSEIDHIPEGGGTSKHNVSGDVKDSKSEVSVGKAKVEQRDLPPGWVTELKTKGGRRDWYFTDPALGIIFRSRKEVFRYLETGEVSKYAIRPKKSSNNDSEIIADLPPSSVKLQESSDRTTRRHLFASNGNSPVSSSSVPKAEDTSSSRVTRTSSKTAVSTTPTTAGKRSRGLSSLASLDTEEASTKRVTRGSAKPGQVSSPTNESPEEETPPKLAAPNKGRLELRNLVLPNHEGDTSTKRVTRGYSKQVSPSTKHPMDQITSNKEDPSNSEGASIKRVTRGSAKTNGVDIELSKEDPPNSENASIKRVKRGAAKTNHIDIESSKVDPPNREDASIKRATRGSTKTNGIDIESSKIDIESSKEDSPVSEDASIKRVTRGSAKTNDTDIEAGVFSDPVCSVVSPVKDLKRKYGKMVDTRTEYDAAKAKDSPSPVTDSKSKVVKKDSAQNGAKERVARKTRQIKEEKQYQEEVNVTRRSSRRLAAIASKPVFNLDSEEVTEIPQAVVHEVNTDDIVALNKIVDSVAQWASQQLAAIPELARKSSVVLGNRNIEEPSDKFNMPCENQTDPKLIGRLDAEQKYEDDPEKLLDVLPGNQTNPTETVEDLQYEKNPNSNQEPQPSFVFGDSWADPCLEFAYKTLTSDLPMDDNPDIQNYFQPQPDTTPMEIDNDLVVPKLRIPTNTFEPNDSTTCDAPITPVFGQRSRAFLPSIDVNLPLHPQESSFDERTKNHKQF